MNLLRALELQKAYCENLATRASTASRLVTSRRVESTRVLYTTL